MTILNTPVVVVGLLFSLIAGGCKLYDFALRHRDSKKSDTSK